MLAFRGSNILDGEPRYMAESGAERPGDDDKDIIQRPDLTDVDAEVRNLR